MATAPGMLSVTDLSTYLYCKRKLYLKKVLKLDEPVKDVMVLGTLRHKAFEDINNHEERLVKATTPDLLQEIHANYKETYAKILRNAVISCKQQLAQFDIPLDQAFLRAWPSVQTEAATRAGNIIRFIQEHQVYGDVLWEQLTPKIQAELRIEAPELFLKGIIDQIEVYPDKVIPIELKTGKAPMQGIWPGHKAQIGAYMVLAESLGKPVTEGKVRYLDIGEDRPVPASPFIRIEITGLVTKTKGILNDQRLPARCEETKCKPCGLKEQCYNDAFMTEKQAALRA